MDDPTTLVADRLLENPVSFPDGQCFERLRPITDFRKDPNEARILYLCRRTRNATSTFDDTNNANGHSEEDDFVMKVKVQYVRSVSSSYSE